MEAGERAELPLVSIMVVSFNERAFIEDCVISAVSQEYPHIEIVVSDDASTDGTREIVAQMAKEHSNVTALFSDVRGGVTNNCNRALSACNGSYVALMAGDDLLCPGKIETQVAWLEADQRRVLCYHDTYLLNERSNRMGLCSADLPMREGVGPSKIIRHGPPGAACSVMLRRSALPDTGFDERIAMVSDWKLMVDSLRGRGVFGFVPGILGCYRVHENGLTQRSKRDPAMTRKWLEDVLMTLASLEATQADEAKIIRERQRLVYLDACWGAMAHGDFRSAKAFAGKALRLSGPTRFAGAIGALSVAYGPAWLGPLGLRVRQGIRGIYRAQRRRRM